MLWPFSKKSKTKKATVSKSRVTRGHRSAWSAANTDRLVSGWVTGSEPINQQIENELRQLRARSRELAKNEPYLRRFFQLCRSNIVGQTGFVMRSEVLRSNGKQDEVAQQAIEKAWGEWGKRGVCCGLNRYTWLEMQNLMVDQVFRDGECILVQYSGYEENEFGISFKFIDPELMDVNHKETTRFGKVRMGVETDSRGRVTAYHFHSTDTIHANYYQSGSRGYIRIPVEFIIHRFITEYVDQIRGVPHGASAMMRIRMLNGYEEAELIAARQGASTMGFIERGEDGGGFEGDGSMLDDDEDDTPVEEPTIEADPGTFHYLENGAKVHDWSPNHPTTAYKEYIKGVLRGIAAGLGVNYNTLANDLEGVNYSSLRSGVLEDRELWKCLQAFFIQQIMDDVFERWLKSSLLHGAIKLPRGLALKSSNIARYRDHSFQGRRWAWVDPQKDMKANELAIQQGLRSRSSIIRETGEDPNQVWREIERENQILEKLGINIGASEQMPPDNSNPEGDPIDDE